MSLWESLSQTRAGLPLVIWVIAGAGALYLIAHRVNTAGGVIGSGNPGGLGNYAGFAGGDVPGPQATVFEPSECPGAIDQSNALGFAPPPGLPEPRLPFQALTGGPVGIYRPLTTEQQLSAQGDIEVR